MWMRSVRFSWWSYFLVLIFSIAQFLLSQVLSGQESELALLQRKVNHLTSQLGLEDQRNRELAATVAELSFTMSTPSPTPNRCWMIASPKWPPVPGRIRRRLNISCC
jgi:hypothetical protein